MGLQLSMRGRIPPISPRQVSFKPHTPIGFPPFSFQAPPGTNSLTAVF